MCIISCLINVIVVEGVVDVWCCVFYFIIEYLGVIFLEFWCVMGNWIYGCDDC